MLPIDIGISHDDDFIITQRTTHGFVILLVAYIHTNCRYKTTNFCVVEQIFKPALFNIQGLTSQRQNSLIHAITPGFCASTCTVPFHQEQFRFFGIAGGTIEQLPRKSATAKNILPITNCLSGLGCSFSCLCSVHDHIKDDF